MLVHLLFILALQFCDNIFFKDGENMQEGKDIKMDYIDTRFLQTLNIKPVAGRIFSDDYYSADTTDNRIIIK